MTVENLNKAHADAMHACQLAEQQLEQARHNWKRRIAGGADDDELDRLELDRLKLERNIERLRVKEQAAHAAVTAAEQAEQAKARKAAADAFLRQHVGLQAQLDAVEEAAQAYAAAVAKLEAGQGAYFDAAVTAQQMACKPAVTGLRMTTDLLNVAKRANGIPATLNARFC